MSPHKPGEWIAAGYCGEGMSWAWLCGIALGVMAKGNDHKIIEGSAGRPRGRVRNWFPPELYVTKERLKKADLENLSELFVTPLLEQQMIPLQPGSETTLVPGYGDLPGTNIFRPDRRF
ncbi:uncharacterized protein F4822DRAFT_403258 [Hypoxylon trugodes]|uniref:uncharacterized protein n=1 Tax=Hypoxylon trugodes TaxID=326681 RepID=UPI0021A11445|nr:uncharacterized protein F4822DRAFT_403258 [Hypoxylon trugodes]KAI1388584.1 hypothetical protein F4822DRAFT_403258 [Hypoxylon trugodes]